METATGVDPGLGLQGHGSGCRAKNHHCSVTASVTDALPRSNPSTIASLASVLSVSWGRHLTEVMRPFNKKNHVRPGADEPSRHRLNRSSRHRVLCSVSTDDWPSEPLLLPPLRRNQSLSRRAATKFYPVHHT
jgi:hypothetical protein